MQRSWLSGEPARVILAPRGEQIYAGYWRDLDGNKGNFICYRQKGPAA
jgi:hypothetical protein